MMLVLTLVVVILLLLASPHPAVHLAGNAAWLASGNPGPGHGTHLLVSHLVNCLIFVTKGASYLKFMHYFISNCSSSNDMSVYVLVPTVHCTALYRTAQEPKSPAAVFGCAVVSGLQCWATGQ